MQLGEATEWHRYHKRSWVCFHCAGTERNHRFSKSNIFWSKIIYVPKHLCFGMNRIKNLLFHVLRLAILTQGELLFFN